MNVNPDGEVAQPGPVIAGKMNIPHCSSNTTFFVLYTSDVAEVFPQKRWTLGLDFA